MLCTSPPYIQLRATHCIVSQAFGPHTYRLGTIPRNRIRSSTKDYQLIQIPRNHASFRNHFQFIRFGGVHDKSSSPNPADSTPIVRNRLQKCKFDGFCGAIVRALAHWMIWFPSNPRGRSWFLLLSFFCIQKSTIGACQQPSCCVRGVRE